MRMINDKVLIKPKEIEKVTGAGIIIPDTAQEKPEEGIVISVGEGRYKGDVLIPLLVKEGDRVLFSKYAGTEMRIEGNDYVMVREHDIFGVLCQ